MFLRCCQFVDCLCEHLYLYTCILLPARCCYSSCRSRMILHLRGSCWSLLQFDETAAFLGIFHIWLNVRKVRTEGWNFHCYLACSAKTTHYDNWECPGGCWVTVFCRRATLLASFRFQLSSFLDNRDVEPIEERVTCKQCTVFSLPGLRDRRWLLLHQMRQLSGFLALAMSSLLPCWWP